MAEPGASSNGQERLAVILTGNATRAAAHLGALQSLDDAGLRPDVLVGVSGGAVAAALYAAAGGAAAARVQLDELVRTHSWQDLVAIDFDGLRQLSSRPYEVTGFFSGDRLQQALLGTTLGHQGFAQLEPTLFVLTCDLNSGRELVFGPVTQEALGEDPPFQAFARTEADLVRVNVAAACRASCTVPGVIEPLSLDQYCLVDGSLRARRALDVAAAQEGVTRILWLHAGLGDDEGFSLVTDYAGQSFAAAVAHSLTVAMADQFDPHTGDPALDGKALRFVNLATASVGVAETLKTQQVYESGRRSLQALLAKPALGDGGLFSADGDAIDAALAEDKDDIEGPRWEVIAGAGGRGVVAIVDRTPPIQQEFGYEFDEYLQKSNTPKVAAREPRGSVDWATAQAEREIGVWPLAGMFFSKALYYTWRGIADAAATAWDALSLGRVWRKTTDSLASGAVYIDESVSRGGSRPEQPSPEEKAPTPEPTAEDSPVPEAHEEAGAVAASETTTPPPPDTTEPKKS